MASDPSFSACNNVDPLLAVEDESSEGDSTCNNGDNALAVVTSPGSETNSIAQSNVCPPLKNEHCWILTIAMDQTGSVFPFKRLPIELQNKIIACAMRATNRKISFSCLTNANFKPNVAVGLLLVK